MATECAVAGCTQRALCVATGTVVIKGETITVDVRICPEHAGMIGGPVSNYSIAEP